MNPFALLSLLPLVAAPLLHSLQQGDPVTAEYHAAYEDRDEKRLEELWNAHPQRILVTIDADLEGSLSAWEKDPDATEAIEALEARAVWGAMVASRATGRGIFHDYAASFAGWTDEEKGNFRQGQAAFGAARKALSEGKSEEALEAARRCRELAAPLGDWWGTAMGYSAEGRALLALERPAEASAASGTSRLLYADLGLGGSEYGEIGALVDATRALERWSRLRALATAGGELGQALGVEGARKAWLEVQLEAEEALGLKEAADATRKEIGG